MGGCWTAPVIHMENHPGSVSLPHATEEKHPGLTCVTLQLREKEFQNMVLGRDANISSPYCKTSAWRLEKYQDGSQATGEKTTSLPKGLLGHSKNKSDEKERKVKERSPPKSAVFGRKRTESHEGYIRFSRLPQAQDFLHLSLPFVPETKCRQPPERCQRSEPPTKCLGRYRPRLATLSTAKEAKTIFLKHCEDGETSQSRSLLNTRQKMHPPTILCHSESKLFSKRIKSECLNHRPPTQDLSSTERISFLA